MRKRNTLAVRHRRAQRRIRCRTNNYKVVAVPTGEMAKTPCGWDGGLFDNFPGSGYLELWNHLIFHTPRSLWTH